MFYNKYLLVLSTFVGCKGLNSRSGRHNALKCINSHTNYKIFLEAMPQTPHGQRGDPSCTHYSMAFERELRTIINQNVIN